MRIDHVGFGKASNRRRQRGGQKQSLSVTRTLAKDPLDLRTEADVKHSVGFIENDAPDTAGAKRLALQVIMEASRCPNHDLNTVLELPQLTGDVLAAGENRDFRLDTPGQAGRFTTDLVGKFSRRYDHNRLRVATILKRVQLLQDGYREGGGLPRSRSGLPDHILPFHRQRNQLRLNGRRFLETCLFQRPTHHGRQIEFVKRLDLDIICHRFQLIHASSVAFQD